MLCLLISFLVSSVVEVSGKHTHKEEDRSLPSNKKGANSIVKLLSAWIFIATCFADPSAATNASSTSVLRLTWLPIDFG